MDDKDVATMHTIIERTPNADVVIRALASLKRTDKTTDLRRLQVRIQKEFGAPIGTEQLEAVAREWQVAGWGRLKVERGTGAHSRFTWKPGVNYTQLAALALADQPRTLLGRTGLVTAPLGRTGGARNEHAKAALVLTLSSGQELRLTLDDARDLKAQLASL